MEFYKPILYKKKEVLGQQHQGDDGTKLEIDASGEQHLADENAKKYPCFKCERLKPTHKGPKHCRFEEKEDVTPVNAQAQIGQKFSDLTDQRRARKGSNGSETLGTTHMVDREVVPTEEQILDWDNVLNDEDSYGGNTVWEWAFKKQGVVAGNVKIDSNKRDIVFDVSQNKHHVCNQRAIESWIDE